MVSDLIFSHFLRKDYPYFLPLKKYSTSVLLSLYTLLFIDDKLYLSQ